eukprot:TCONS_00051733-protein
MNMEQSDLKTFCNALHEKFSSQYDFDNLDNIIVRSLNCPQQSLDKRKIIGLDHCSIKNAGNYDDIANSCPMVQELDVSSNYFEDWSEIINITKCLRHLTCLNVSHNPLDRDTLLQHDHNLSTPQKSIHSLVINNTGIDFQSLLKLLDIYPSVAVLHFCINDISSIPGNLNKQYENVTTVSMAKNNIKTWADIRKIGKLFPNLVSLNISENLFKEIKYEKNSNDFCHLKNLNIMECPIDDWESIENLQHLPQLRELRIKGCPIYAKKSLTEKQQRCLTVARLPNVTKLNGSNVEDEEREDAERLFIRFHMKGENKPTRYQDLIQTYGKLDELAEVNFDRSFIVNVLVKGDVESPFLYSLDCSQTVRSLYKELGTRLKLKKNKFNLVHFEQEEEENDSTYVGRKMKKSNVQRVTSYYVREGDSVQVIRLDLDID